MEGTRRQSRIDRYSESCSYYALSSIKLLFSNMAATEGPAAVLAREPPNEVNDTLMPNITIGEYKEAEKGAANDRLDIPVVYLETAW